MPMVCLEDYKLKKCSFRYHTCVDVSKCDKISIVTNLCRIVSDLIFKGNCMLILPTYNWLITSNWYKIGGYI